MSARTALGRLLRWLAWSGVIVVTVPFAWLALARFDVPLHPKMQACERPDGADIAASPSALRDPYTAQPVAWDKQRKVLWLTRRGARPNEEPTFEAPRGGS